MTIARTTERGLIVGYLVLAVLVLVGALAVGGAPTAASDPGVSALAHAMPNQGWAPMQTHLSAFGSQSDLGRIVRYEWDLDGNGAYETDATAAGGYVSLSFARHGTYRIGLRVTDDLGRVGLATTEVTVRHPASSRVDYDRVFDDTTVGRIDLQVTSANWSLLWAEPVTKEREVEADAIVFGTPVRRIGLSMKGNGSLEASGVKKPWKLDINEHVDGQDVEHLSMLLLHNGFADPSLLREKLAYDMLRHAGAHAGFVTFVQVWIDLVDDAAPAQFWGVYTLVERPDRTYLANRFGGANNAGNLYKADAWFEQGAADLVYYGEDIGDYPMPRGRIAYRNQPDESAADHSDIIALARVIDGVTYDTPEDFAAALEQVMNVDSYLRYLAATFLHLNLDVYPYTGNNYYLYHRPDTDRFEWLAWDENSAWGMFGGNADFPLFGSTESLGPVSYAPLFTKVFEVDRYRRTYAAYVDLLVRTWFNADALAPRAEALHDLIAPLVRQGDPMFVGGDAWFDLDQFDQGWRDLVELTDQRASAVERMLAEEYGGT